MKISMVIFLFCTSLYGADLTIATNVVGDLTTRTWERLGKNGMPGTRMEIVYRGGTNVLQTLSRQNKQGMMSIVSRGYYAGGKLIMSESDKDGDGVFESVVVYRVGTQDIEVFHRGPDGVIRPARTGEVELTKIQFAVLDEAAASLLQTNKMSDAEIEASLGKTRQKVQDLEKEKQGQK